jgi:hypothetical protein
MTLMSKQFQSTLILSTGRTGTKFLASVLGDLYPEVNVYHEGGERSRLVNIFSNAHLAGIVPEWLLLRVWKRAIEKQLVLTQNQNKNYIDSNNHLYVIAALWPELYQNLKVIHIVRDPRTYIRSHLNWSRSRFKSFIANYLTPFWQPMACLQGDMRISEWINLSKLEKFAWIWQYKNSLIAQLGESQIPYLSITFEDLFEVSHPEKSFNRLLDFIGLPPCEHVEKHFQTSINVSQKRRIPAWTQWPDELCRSIASLCGQGMVKYGYGGEPEWIKKSELEGVQP